MSRDAYECSVAVKKVMSMILFTGDAFFAVKSDSLLLFVAMLVLLMRPARAESRIQVHCCDALVVGRPRRSDGRSRGCENWQKAGHFRCLAFRGAVSCIVL